MRGFQWATLAVGFSAAAWLLPVPLIAEQAAEGVPAADTGSRADAPAAVTESQSAPAAVDESQGDAPPPLAPLPREASDMLPETRAPAATESAGAESQLPEPAEPAEPQAPLEPDPPTATDSERRQGHQGAPPASPLAPIEQSPPRTVEQEPAVAPPPAAGPQAVPENRREHEHDDVREHEATSDPGPAHETGHSAPIRTSPPAAVIDDERDHEEPGNDRDRGAMAGAEVQAEEPQIPRETLLPLVQPLWSELTKSQQRVLQPFASQWNTWAAADKRRWIALANRVPRMRAEDQDRARKRIVEWAALTPEQRRVARQNYRIASELTPDERRAQWERYRQLSPEEQKALRARGSSAASNTAARTATRRSGLAPEAAQPLAPGPERSEP
jgi:hypothetical protein